MAVNAQQVTLKGIGHNNRYDDGDQMKTQYLGWNSELQKAIFIVDNGIYKMTWDGATLSTPEKEPPVIAEEIKGNNEKEIWANNFNMMYGNSGAAYINGRLVTVMSRDEQSTPDETLFTVRKWDATTGDLLSTEIRPKSATLESAGMAYNPADGKVYGLFYLTGNQLPEEITSDPDYFTDQDDDMTDGDAGYCLCEINLAESFLRGRERKMPRKNKRAHERRLGQKSLNKLIRSVDIKPRRMEIWFAYLREEAGSAVQCGTDSDRG